MVLCTRSREVKPSGVKLTFGGGSRRYKCHWYYWEYAYLGSLKFSASVVNNTSKITEVLKNLLRPTSSFHILYLLIRKTQYSMKLSKKREKYESLKKIVVKPSSNRCNLAYESSKGETFTSGSRMKTGRTITTTNSDISKPNSKRQKSNDFRISNGNSYAYRSLNVVSRIWWC